MSLSLRGVSSRDLHDIQVFMHVHVLQPQQEIKPTLSPQANAAQGPEDYLIASLDMARFEFVSDLALSDPSSIPKPLISLVGRTFANKSFNKQMFYKTTALTNTCFNKQCLGCKSCQLNKQCSFRVLIFCSG